MRYLVRSSDGDLLCQLGSIPDMGRKTAIAMIVATNGFRSFKDAKQLISSFGLAPMIRWSGTSIRGKSRLSRSGSKEVRNLPLMFTFIAYKYSKDCTELYQRIVIKGKKLALIAVSNKLIRQAHVIPQSG